MIFTKQIIMTLMILILSCDYCWVTKNGLDDKWLSVRLFTIVYNKARLSGSSSRDGVCWLTRARRKFCFVRPQLDSMRFSKLAPPPLLPRTIISHMIPHPYHYFPPLSQLLPSISFIAFALLFISLIHILF